MKNLDWVKWSSALTNTLNQKYKSIVDNSLLKYLSVHPLSSMQKDLTFEIASAFCRKINIQNYPDIDPAEKTEVLATDILRSSLHLSYYHAKSLESIMTSDEAKLLWMEFVDFQTKTKPQSFRLNNPKDLLFANSQPDKIFEKGFNLVEYELDDGRAGVKITKCKWNEILRECEDPSYGYAVACHYDFQAFKQANPNFLLTRNQTLLANANFCDFCIHDTSVEKTISHPDSEFWKKL